MGTGTAIDEKAFDEIMGGSGLASGPYGLEAKELRELLEFYEAHRLEEAPLIRVKVELDPSIPDGEVHVRENGKELGRIVNSALRDPRVFPRSGDVVRKWEQNFLINDVVMGCVYTAPSLSAHKDWVGIQYFKDWAKNADVVFVEDDTTDEVPVHGTCWFAERHFSPRWLQGFSYDTPIWTDDPLKAVRFQRKCDAEALCGQFGLFSGIGEGAHTPKPTEHIFKDNPKRESGSLLKPASKTGPTECHCKPGHCLAPRPHWCKDRVKAKRVEVTTGVECGNSNA